MTRRCRALIRYVARMMNARVIKGRRRRRRRRIRNRITRLFMCDMMIQISSLCICVQDVIRYGILNNNNLVITRSSYFFTLLRCNTIN
jgi:hypothetical protein